MNQTTRVLCSSPEEAAIANMALGLTKITNTTSELDDTGIRKHAIYISSKDVDQFETNRLEIRNLISSKDPQTLTQYTGECKGNYDWVGTKH